MSLRYLTAGESHRTGAVRHRRGLPGRADGRLRGGEPRADPPAAGLRPRRPPEDRARRGAVPLRPSRRHDDRLAHRARGVEQGPRELEGPRLALRPRRPQVHPGASRARRPGRRHEVRLRRRPRRARARQRPQHGGLVAVGALARQLLARFGVRISSRVTAIGERERRVGLPPTDEQLAAILASDLGVDERPWRPSGARSSTRRRSAAAPSAAPSRSTARASRPGSAAMPITTGASTRAWPARCAASPPSGPPRSARACTSSCAGTPSTTPSTTRPRRASTATRTEPAGSRRA